MRKRRREGLIVVPLHVRQAEIEGLIRRGLLAAEARNDRWAIACALGKLLDRWPLAQSLASSFGRSLAEYPYLAAPGNHRRR